jgi:hypothetical protein
MRFTIQGSTFIRGRMSLADKIELDGSGLRA